MSSTVTVTPTKGARGIGLVSIIAGIILLLATRRRMMPMIDSNRCRCFRRCDSDGPRHSTWSRTPPRTPTARTRPPAGAGRSRDGQTTHTGPAGERRERSTARRTRTSGRARRRPRTGWEDAVRAHHPPDQLLSAARRASRPGPRGSRSGTAAAGHDVAVVCTTPARPARTACRPSGSGVRHGARLAARRPGRLPRAPARRTTWRGSCAPTGPSVVAARGIVVRPRRRCGRSCARGCRCSPCTASGAARSAFPPGSTAWSAGPAGRCCGRPWARADRPSPAPHGRDPRS